MVCKGGVERVENVLGVHYNIIYFCLQKRDTGSGPLYPIMGFGQITISRKKEHDYEN